MLLAVIDVIQADKVKPHIPLFKHIRLSNLFYKYVFFDRIDFNHNILVKRPKPVVLSGLGCYINFIK